MNSTAFYEPALATLRQLSHEPMATAEELRQLQRQLSSAIEWVESGDGIPMTEQERIDHHSRFGVGAFVVGDFVINRRIQ